MRITADTNVLVSATFWHGASEHIVELVEKKQIHLIISKEIINEFVRVLDYPEMSEMSIRKFRA